jgi:hypothetical protein
MFTNKILRCEHKWLYVGPHVVLLRLVSLQEIYGSMMTNLHHKSWKFHHSITVYDICMMKTQ